MSKVISGKVNVSASYVIMRDLKLLMSGLGGWVMGRMGLGPSDRGEDRGPSTWSSGSEEPPSPPWLWGSCSMVSCSSRLVSWMSRSIWRKGPKHGSKIKTKTSLLQNMKSLDTDRRLISIGKINENRNSLVTTSSRGTLWIGVPLISRILSPTWMEFFTSGLMQSVSTLKEYEE